MMYLGLHTLQRTTSTGGGFDADGVPLPDTETVEDIPCDIVPNGRQQTVYLDGKATCYSYSVTLDGDCPDFARGDTVRLFNGEELLGDKSFTVLQFFRYRLTNHAVLWV